MSEIALLDFTQEITCVFLQRSGNFPTAPRHGNDQQQAAKLRNFAPLSECSLDWKRRRCNSISFWITSDRWLRPSAYCTIAAFSPAKPPSENYFPVTSTITSEQFIIYYLNATTGQYHSYRLLLFILIMYGHFSFPFVILFFKSTFYTAELPVSILCSQSLPFLIPFSCINGFCSPSKSFLPGVTWPSILKQLLVINIFMFTLFTQLTLISALQDRLS